MSIDSNKTDNSVYKWTDFAENGVPNRNNCVNFFDVFKETFFGKRILKDAYCGMYAFKDDFKEYLDKNKTVSRFKGDHFSHLFIMDIDHPFGDIEEASKSAASLVEWLYEIGLDENQFYVFFSGKKGFHIYIPSSIIGLSGGSSHSQDMKRFAKVISEASGVGLLSEAKGAAGIDLIYDTTRLIRLPNSIHADTGLHKIQIEPKALFGSYDSIMDKARSPSEPAYVIPRDKLIVNKALNDLYSESLIMSFADAPKDFLNVKPERGASEGHIKNAKVCISRLLKGVGLGQRDKAAIRIADHYRKQGLAKDLVENILLSWNQKNDPPLEQRDIYKTVQSAFTNDMDYGCYDEVLAAHCSSQCFLYSKLARGQETDAAIDEKMFKTKKDIFYEYATRFSSEEGLVLGIPELDNYVKIHKGHVVQYMAKAGGGKTAFAMHCMKNLSAANNKVLFLSLEMTSADVGERGFQMANKKTVQYLERLVVDLINLKKTEKEIADELEKQSAGFFDNVYVVDEDSASIEKIEQYIFKAKQKFGIDIVFLDYLSRVAQSNSNNYEHISHLAKMLKTIAKRHNVAIVYLHQVNRSVENYDAAIEISSGRDSGQTEESADIILGSWRPGSAVGEDVFQIRVLKNRRGKANIDIKLTFIAETMQFSEYVDQYQQRPQKQYGLPKKFE